MEAMDAFNGLKGKDKSGSDNQDIEDNQDKNTVAAMICCGDYNCGMDGNECIVTLKQGYQSSFHEMNPNVVEQKVVSHFNHNKESVLVDHIFWKRNDVISEKEDVFTVEPVKSYLYPESIGVKKWSKKWVLSDHRPLVTEFTIKKDENEE